MEYIEHTHDENDFNRWWVLCYNFNRSTNTYHDIQTATDWLMQQPGKGRFTVNEATASWWFEDKQDAFLFYLKFTDILYKPFVQHYLSPDGHLMPILLKNNI